MAGEQIKFTLDLNTPSEQVKRRRHGRPRRSEAAGNMVVSRGMDDTSLSMASVVSSPPMMNAFASMPMRGDVVSPPLISAVVSPSVPRIVSQTPHAFNLSPSAENSVPGEILADTTVAGFTVHVVQINSGEDLIRRIMSLVENGPRGICIISANGTVRNAMISHACSSGATIVYEGQFQILSLTGSFTVAETGVGRCRMGGLSVSLSCPDGRVIGGEVAGALVAASAMQTVVGSFILNTYRRMQ
ncbi:AT-hook motif nuclear-localized protein 10-like [Apium graveolens]|uniref:AT-hook motif nuclear-localized protein 10-like n=1 Tax=Apium graveolens TaxID=4045 RepID=UPI003D7BE1E2